MPDEWLELSIETPPEYVEPLTEIFHRYGEGGVAVEQPGGFNPDEGESPPIPDRVVVKTYLPIDHTTDHRRSQIDVGVRLVAHLAPVTELRERRVSQSEWQNSWKEFFHVLRVGERIVVCPTWREYEAKPDEVIVHLDPGMAFGTGHHPTTRMCLEIIEQTVTPGDSVLDLGCGSGILSIVAVKLGAERAVGLEIDPVAVKAGRANIDLNRAADSVELIHGTLPSPRAPAGSFDCAFANISARVVTDLAARLVECIAPGGRLLVSGVIEKHLDGVTDALIAEGATIERQEIDGDWVALLASV
jgi:ribosomal protein L11 methyltransferase